MTGASPLLPGGFRRSAWADLSPADRAVFLQEVLVLTGFQTLGTVNYDSNLEPLLYDPVGDRLVSIVGEEIPANPIEVEVTRGFFLDGRADGELVTVAVIIAVLFGVILIARR